MKKTALLILLSISFDFFDITVANAFDLQQTTQNKKDEKNTKVLTVEQLRNLMRHNDITAEDYNLKTLCLKGRFYSLRDKGEYYEVKLAPFENKFLSIDFLSTIRCKFSKDQRESLKDFKKGDTLVVRGILDYGMRIIMDDCVLVDENQLGKKSWFSFF